MALPTNRDATLAPGSQVASALINKLQDCIIGKKCPSISKGLMPIIFGGNFPTNWSASVGVGGAYMVSNAAPTSFMIQIPTEAGDRITGLNVTAFGDGAVDCTYTAIAQDAAFGITTLCTFTDTNRAAAWGVAALTPFTARTMLAGEVLLCYVSANAANYRIANLRPVYDRL